MMKDEKMLQTNGGRKPMLLPHQVGYQYGLVPYRHFSKFSTLSKSEQFLSENIIGRLTCHKDDVYEDTTSEDEEPTYVYAMQYSPLRSFENYLAIASEEGRLTIRDTNKIGDEAIVTRFPAHNNAIFDVSWRPDNCASKFQVATASGDQTVCIFEIASSSGSWTLLHTLRGYTRSVKCVEFAPENGNISRRYARTISLFWI